MILNRYFNKIILVLILLFPLLLNYYYGKYFNECKTCKPNEVFLININKLNDKLIKELENDIRKNGTILDPKLNYNNAKGKKINYKQLSENIKKVFEDDTLKNKVSYVVKEKVEYADNTEQYKIFARLYEDESDFLDWHYDNNFTLGNRYTLVIPLLVDEGNTSEFMIRDRKTLEEKTIKIPLGKGVVYNGSITYHKISKQTKGKRRMVVIIPFYSNKKKSLLGIIREKIRNITDKELSL